MRPGLGLPVACEEAYGRVMNDRFARGSNPEPIISISACTPLPCRTGALFTEARDMARRELRLLAISESSSELELVVLFSFRSNTFSVGCRFFPPWVPGLASRLKLISRSSSAVVSSFLIWSNTVRLSNLERLLWKSNSGRSWISVASSVAHPFVASRAFCRRVFVFEACAAAMPTRPPITPGVRVNGCSASWSIGVLRHPFPLLRWISPCSKPWS